MKTKFLFTMCAATLLAGCANEEFLSTPETDIANRAKVEVNLGATMGAYTLNDEASTRTIWEGGDYKWESTDMIGACLLDAAIANTPAYTGIRSNYPFAPVGAITTPVSSASFATNTAVYEGIYAFYHGYNPKMTAAATLATKFPATQVYDAEKPYAHLTEDNFFISPLIKIVGGIAYGEENKIPVQFTSLYSGFAPTLENTSTSDVKVSKIEITHNTSFKLGGNVNTVIGTFGAVINSNETDLTKLAKDIEDARNLLRAADKDLYETAETGKMVSLVMSDVTIAAGAKMQFRMLFPAGQYANANLTLKVYTDKGVFETKAIPTAANTVDFSRDKFIASTYKMKDFTLPAEFAISSEADWNYAIGFIGAHLNSYLNGIAVFNLADDVVLTKDAVMPHFAVYVNGTDELTLKGGEFSFAERSYIANLVVSKDATLNLDGKSFINSLTNNGTVNVPEGATVVSQSDNDYATWAALAATAKIFGVSNFITADGASTVIDGTLELGGATTTTLAAKSTITNNGTLAIHTADVTNAGVITNNGKLTAKDSGVDLINTGVINLGADCTVQSLESSAAKVITNDDANALITLAVIKDVFVNKDGEATTTSLVENTQGSVSVAITPSSSLDDLAAIQEVNSATISGSWNKAAIDKVDAATTIKGLILNNATVDVKSVTDGKGAFKNITAIKVMGKTSTISNSGSTAIALSVDADELTIDKGAKLVVGKNVKYGLKSATEVATISVQGELDITGAVVGNIGVGAAATSDPANTDAKVIVNEDAILTAASALSTNDFTMASINNYGTIANNGKLYATSVDNKIVGKSVFMGNVTDVTVTKTVAGF